MLCVIALVAVICGWPHFRRYHAVWRLGDCVGVVLTQLPDDEQSQVADWIQTCVGSNGDDPSSDDFQQNWLVHRSSVRGTEGRLYVLEMHPTLSNPGSSYCRLHIVTHWGRLIRTIRFKVGYRAWPKTARFDESKRDLLCLVVETSGMWSGETRQFYRITDSDVELLRSEQLDGTMKMGNGNLFDIDNKPPDWTSWEELLVADREIDQLRGLAAFWSYDIQQGLGARDRKKRVPVDVKTRWRLDELSKSKDPWISEEATAAVRLLAKWQPDAAATGGAGDPN